MILWLIVAFVVGAVLAALLVLFGVQGLHADMQRDLDKAIEEKDEAVKARDQAIQDCDDQVLEAIRNRNSAQDRQHEAERKLKQQKRAYASLEREKAELEQRLAFAYGEIARHKKAYRDFGKHAYRDLTEEQKFLICDAYREIGSIKGVQAFFFDGQSGGTNFYKVRDILAEAGLIGQGTN